MWDCWRVEIIVCNAYYKNKLLILGSYEELVIGVFALFHGFFNVRYTYRAWSQQQHIYGHSHIMFSFSPIFIRILNGVSVDTIRNWSDSVLADVPYSIFWKILVIPIWTIGSNVGQTGYNLRPTGSIWDELVPICYELRPILDQMWLVANWVELGSKWVERRKDQMRTLRDQVGPVRNHTGPSVTNWSHMNFDSFLGTKVRHQPTNHPHAQLGTALLWTEFRLADIQLIPPRSIAQSFVWQVPALLPSWRSERLFSDATIISPHHDHHACPRVAVETGRGCGLFCTKTERHCVAPSFSNDVLKLWVVTEVCKFFIVSYV